MATVSSLSAPGVEVREYDNSLRITSNTGTTVFVPGYAAQGPVEEVITVGSITDFENIYGIPTNDAERYFYYTCLAILNNSGPGTTLLTSRLPYGEGEGDNVATAYTMLAYPAIPVIKNSDNSKSYNYFVSKNLNTSYKEDNSIEARGINELFQLVDIPVPTLETENETSVTAEEATPVVPEVLELEVNINSSKEVKNGVFKITGLTAGYIPSLTAKATDITNKSKIKWEYNEVKGESDIDIYSEPEDSLSGNIILHLTSQLVNEGEIYGYFTAKLRYACAKDIFDVKSSTISYIEEDEDGKKTVKSKDISGIIGKEFSPTTTFEQDFIYVEAYKVATEFAPSTTNDVTYVVGAPAIFNVSLTEYYQIVSGEFFTWENKPDIANFGKDIASTLAHAAFVTINTSRATINDSYEGYYFGITDNLFNEPSNDYILEAVKSVKFTNWNREPNKFNGITDIKSAEGDDNNKFITISPSRLDFHIASSNKGSISNVLQTGTTSYDTSAVDYDDTINFGLFKLSKSTVGTEAMKLTYEVVEKYNAAMGKTRMYSTASAITPQNYFVENIVESSKNIAIMVNPYIATKIKVDENGVLRGKVRFLSSKLLKTYSTFEKKYVISSLDSSLSISDDLSKRIKLAANNIRNWETLAERVGVSIKLLKEFGGTDAAYNRFAMNDSLYPFATYTVAKKNNKYIGSTPAKITRALELVSNDEEYPDIDIIVEGGLGTIYAYSNNSQNIISEGSNSIIAGENSNTPTGENGQNCSTFNADMILQGIEDLRTSRNTITEDAEKVVQDYISVQEAFQSLANSFQNGGRGDTFYVADILRGILLRGANTKVERLYGTKLTNNVYSEAEPVNHSWATSIYNPIKHSIESFTTSYASVYAQWVKVLDGFTNEKFWVPVSGFMTALMCASDQIQGPWYAAAGLNRGIVEGVLDCALNPNQKQRGDLYKICVNSVPKLANIGITNWGIRTLSKKASAFDQNTCRRTFLFIEKAIKKLLRYYLFEPNNSYTQLSIYNEIEPYLESIRNQGGIYSYTCVCDSSNNTPEIVNAGNLAVDVSAAPTRTAEFIVLNMTANKYSQEVSTSEFNA